MDQGDFLSSRKNTLSPPLSASPKAAANLSLSSAVGFPVGTYRVR
jgi:hypothetical protein